MDFPCRILLLKIPTLLQHQRMLLNLIFVSDYVSRIGSRYLKHFYFDVANQLAAFDFGERYFRSVLVLHLVVFALRRNTPAVLTLRLEFEEDKDSAVVTSAGTQDFVGFADDSFDLVCRNDV